MNIQIEVINQEGSCVRCHVWDESGYPFQAGWYKFSDTKTGLSEDGKVVRDGEYLLTSSDYDKAALIALLLRK